MNKPSDHFLSREESDKFIKDFQENKSLMKNREWCEFFDVSSATLYLWVANNSLIKRKYADVFYKYLDRITRPKEEKAVTPFVYKRELEKIDITFEEVLDFLLDNKKVMEKNRNIYYAINRGIICTYDITTNQLLAINQPLLHDIEPYILVEKKIRMEMGKFYLDDKGVKYVVIGNSQIEGYDLKVCQMDSGAVFDTDTNGTNLNIVREA